jgi:hypothetical protein
MNPAPLAPVARTPGDTAPGDYRPRARGSLEELPPSPEGAVPVVGIVILSHPRTRPR